jgi:hypothetical protein
MSRLMAVSLVDLLAVTVRDADLGELDGTDRKGYDLGARSYDVVPEEAEETMRRSVLVIIAKRVSLANLVLTVRQQNVPHLSNEVLGQNGYRRQ